MEQSSANRSVSTIPGWRIFTSDANRLWASRMRPFSTDAEKAGAYRTVDADDMVGLIKVISEQEEISEQVNR
ncbi:MAG: hypothetical protein C0P63_017955 [Actinomycetales bacterium]